MTIKITGAKTLEHRKWCVQLIGRYENDLERGEASESGCMYVLASGNPCAFVRKAKTMIVCEFYP